MIRVGRLKIFIKYEFKHIILNIYHISAYNWWIIAMGKKKKIWNFGLPMV